MPCHALCRAHVVAGHSIIAHSAPSVAIRFRVRPENELILSVREVTKVVHYLNKKGCMAKVLAEILDYLGHPDAASICITLVYWKGVRRHL